MTKAPGSIFLSHGAPTLALESCAARDFLIRLGSELPRPTAIAVISAHWETTSIHVSSTPAPALIYDFHGFPAPLYALEYEPPGAPALAREIVASLRDRGFETIEDAERGLDHGAWIPLRLMFPEADIPVFQISVCTHANAGFHYRYGQALADLSKSGVLVIGSGAATHNLEAFRSGASDPRNNPTPAYAKQFCAWLADTLEHGDADALVDWQIQAPQALRAHPSSEHLLPLHVAAGAAGADWRGRRIHESYQYGVLAMDSYAFDSATPSCG